jgi:hypothetical protein
LAGLGEHTFFVQIRHQPDTPGHQVVGVANQILVISRLDLYDLAGIGRAGC